MTLAELLTELGRARVHLEVHGHRLRFSPRDRMTPALADAMTAHKGELLAALAEPAGPCERCGNAVLVRLRARPIVCPGCCPVAPEAVAEKLVWIDDPPGLADFHAEAAKCQQDRETVSGSLSAGVWNWAEGQAWALQAEDREPIPPPYRLIGCGFGPVRSPWRAAPLPVACPRCGQAEFTDVVIHDGASTRRDCERCGRTWGFARWHDGSAGGMEPTQTKNKRI